MASFVFFGCSLVAPAAHAKSTKLRRSWRGAFAVRYCPASLRAEDGETPPVEPSLYIGYPFAKFGHLATERRNIGSQRSEIAAQRSEIAAQCRNAFVRGRTRRRNAFVRGRTRRRNAFVHGRTRRRNAFVHGHTRRRNTFVHGRTRRLESLVHVHTQHSYFPVRSYASFHDQRSQRNPDSKYGPQLRLHRCVPPGRARQPLSGASRSLKLHLSAPPTSCDLQSSRNRSRIPALSIRRRRLPIFALGFHEAPSAAADGTRQSLQRERVGNLPGYPKGERLFFVRPTTSAIPRVGTIVSLACVLHEPVRAESGTQPTVRRQPFGKIGETKKTRLTGTATPRGRRPGWRTRSRERCRRRTDHGTPGQSAVRRAGEGATRPRPERRRHPGRWRPGSPEERPRHRGRTNRPNSGAAASRKVDRNALLWNTWRRDSLTRIPDA